jgi:hypothetical protein
MPFPSPGIPPLRAVSGESGRGGGGDDGDIESEHTRAQAHNTSRPLNDAKIDTGEDTGENRRMAMGYAEFERDEQIGSGVQGMYLEWAAGPRVQTPGKA